MPKEASVERAMDDPAGTADGRAQTVTPSIPSVPVPLRVPAVPQAAKALPPPKAIDGRAKKKKPNSAKNDEPIKKKTTNGTKNKNTATIAKNTFKKTSPMPTTPAKMPREASHPLAAGERSPNRMKNNTCMIGCDHAKLNHLVPCEGNQFTKKTMERQNFPTNCDECKENFLDLKKNRKITATAPIHCCANALNHRDCECVFALCSPCHRIRENKLIATSGPISRKRKLRITVAPGEKRMPDGTIVARN